MTREYLQSLSGEQLSLSTTVVSGITLLYIIYQALVYFDVPILSPQELLWNALVYNIPKQLLLNRIRRQELTSNSPRSQTHAAKSEALRRLLAMGCDMLGLPPLNSSRDPSIGAASTPSPRQPTPNTSIAPPGLGNWDNSCYQNSVLQGLASLESLEPYLRRANDDKNNTSGSLLETIVKLTNADNNGRQLWTPAKLKSMSSWQQQDAQEYFSKILDELDQESAKSIASTRTISGLESIVEAAAAEPTDKPSSAADLQVTILQPQRNPMDGLLAQRVTCTRCGFSEGLSMIPFNCLTVPVGSDFAYDLEECLDEYTKLEEISDVECAKCTLLRAERQLEQMLPRRPSIQSSDQSTAVDAKVLALPPELRAQAFERLSRIQKALGTDEYEDKTLEDCQIPKKARVSSTKTRQAVIGRAPRTLVVHVNRSVFDEMTGEQRKNYAAVYYPLTLDAQRWMLDHSSQKDRSETETTDLLHAAQSLPSRSRTDYQLKAAVTHYGRHENGHYTCYRRHPLHKSEPHARGHDEHKTEEEPLPEQTQWWRLSDEDVSPVSEEHVLGQKGAFMLFYERESSDGRPTSATEAVTSCAMAEEQSEERTTGVQTDTSCGPDTVVDDPAGSEIHSGETDTFATATSPTPSADHISTETTTEDESEADAGAPPPSQSVQKQPTAPLMRTSRGRTTSRSETVFGDHHFRAMATT